MHVSGRTRQLLVAATLVAMAGAVVASAMAIAVATDQSRFCASCHEMQPFHAAWAAGPHASVACIDCHVDRGSVSRLAHKIVALGEVREHLAGRPTFPLPEPPEVPDERCVACHENVTSDRPGFSHEDHAANGPCQSCHAEAGHAVTTAALAAAGVLNATALETRTRARTAAVGQGAANLPGHIKTDCASCHDMKVTPCRSCHTPNHAARAEDCSTCHSTGSAFAFSHPASTSCIGCHTRPASHSTAACGQCHRKPGVTWAFDHDSAASGADCESCHPRPADHASGPCATCHASGATWAFTHPRSTTCATCHTAPANHSPLPCASCHKAGERWVFTHPGPSANCATCHKPPAGHSASACTKCHRVGATWAFYHPKSTSCASCHRRPANHYGTSCASCHSTSAPWSNATFRHPAIRGGEHTYRSFACTSCHPNGYSSVNCTQCHDSSEPDKDDD